ncbi:MULTISPECIES: DNA replication/repair protein RecF [Dehalobacter]|jgi:DNA replication and repair protein RecF|uniref:DNA replication and repair protein RecF n=2 Tax=Dehalobacter restrictus TaxID=55583 RepID=A0A857DF19_9FIRM|nr:MULTISPECIES: DNA replication/repair protein RecF [Dehalobacter]AHF08715.1 DNA replication protein RecF [Dehalobacter restrictus DSM 9455]MCG1024189.1 DNA replication/repair protein RecF [Dehalobacter sp.]MDJ0305328.1 DNA replication/repair protein RecF [Dehalobacter sp.]OCZ49810.1 DNA replication protein RecF [Dehalobacter sp. TeCB1]QGZ99168.1 DNA replication/repair protein RecF [Dehalobacter restrictus]
MYIKELYLVNFRNYQEQKIDFQPGINLLMGSNGQGKTNILEGIGYLISGKSAHCKSENDLIRWGEKNFYLSGSFLVSERLFMLEGYYETGKKVMKINQLACKRLSDYVGTVNGVSFYPDDLNIVKKGPNERRRFIDLLIAQIRPTHFALLNAYLRAVHQKNILLKNERNINLLRIQLQAWNEQICEIGSKIIINRSEFTDKLNTHCRKIFQSIFSDEDHLDIVYQALGKKDLEQALQSFPEILEKKMIQEIERKAVLFGPHRDEIIIYLNGNDTRIFASQGQQRSLVLSLKLAEMEIIRNEKDEYPILLLDDVLSELDEYRRDYLIEYINTLQKQTIITMTGADDRITNQNAVVYQVSNGNIRRK